MPDMDVVNAENEVQEGLIGDLLNDLSGLAPAEETVVETPVEPVVETPAVETSVVEPVVPVVAATETPVVEEEETSEQIIERLRQQLMAATAGNQQIFPALQGPVAIEGKPGEVANPATPAIAPTEFKASQAYLTEEELDQVIDNPALIVTAIQRAQADIVGQISNNLPSVIQGIVAQQVNQQVLVQRAVTEFYDANSDLRQYAQYAQFVMTEMETKHKDKPYSEIFALTASETRKRLGLKNPAVVEVQRDQTKGEKPAFAGSKRTGTVRPAAKGEWFDPNAADLFNIK